jgi:hypothetical protein
MRGARSRLWLVGPVGALLVLLVLKPISKYPLLLQVFFLKYYGYILRTPLPS